MKERPILFSAPMVRALLEGTKTQTRRIVKPQPSDDAVRLYAGCIVAHEMECCETGGYLGFGFQDEDRLWRCPYGQPGDRLWVRETLQRFDREPPTIQYAADLTPMPAVRQTGAHPMGAALWPWGEKKKRVSIHMDRWASRITLEINSVRVERLQDISDADARAEGSERLDVLPDRSGPVGPCLYATARDSYRYLWGSINGPGSWDANPWVWVISFRPSAQGVTA